MRGFHAACHASSGLQQVLDRMNVRSSHFSLSNKVALHLLAVQLQPCGAHVVPPVLLSCAQLLAAETSLAPMHSRSTTILQQAWR